MSEDRARKIVGQLRAAMGGGATVGLLEDAADLIVDLSTKLPFSHDRRAQAAVLADLPTSVAQEAGSFYETFVHLHKDCLKADAMAEAWTHVLRPYLIGLRDHDAGQHRPQSPDEVLIEAGRCLECGATDAEACRAPCWREFHGGSREATSQEPLTDVQRSIRDGTFSVRSA